MENTFESGKREFYSGNYEAAAQIFNSLIELNIDDYELWNAFGVTQFKLGNTRDALFSFEKALHIQPNFKKAKENREKILLTHPEYRNTIESSTENLKTQICDFCGAVNSKNEWLFYSCRYCGGCFCSKCRLPPNHHCQDIERWKAKPPPGLSLRYQQKGKIESIRGTGAYLNPKEEYLGTSDDQICSTPLEKPPLWARIIDWIPIIGIIFVFFWWIMVLILWWFYGLTPPYT